MRDQAVRMPAGGGEPFADAKNQLAGAGPVVDLDALLNMSSQDLVQLLPTRARTRFSRGLKRKPMALIKKLRKAVEVEALVIQGPMLSTVLNRLKKLEVSVLVLRQRKPSPFCWLSHGVLLSRKVMHPNYDRLNRLVDHGSD